MTASTFRLFSELECVQDHQLVALALGRCVEVAPLLSLRSTAEVYAGLAALNVQHFSLTAVALRESSVTADATVKEFYEVTAPEGAALSMQPNLIDVLCGELEERLRALAPLPRAGAAGSSTDAVRRTAGGEAAALLDSDQHALLLIASSMRKAGLQRASTLTALGDMVRRVAPLPLGALVFLLGELLAAELRVVDVLAHTGGDGELADVKASVALFLAHRIMMQANVGRVLRHAPDTVIRLRRLFETSLILQENATALWDVVRCVKVAHKHVAPKPKDGVERTSRLFKTKYAVKPQRVTSDLSEAERFVPPQFKTWRSPVHSPRGGHRRDKKQPRVVPFGNQRITKDYMKKKRRKYARHA
ncbi:hypothetical protein STCU_06366 [Strigomonas culicis]|nr:hypothetical protein STCU_06366 [Strigomonas culicis]|eukprot:EPY26010.1 hypothetical protein STCU_06366 [Strigomonas culicis]